MLSMTGYGRADYQQDGINLTVEVRSVNNRNFDFNAKMPRAFISLEDSVRKTVNSFIKRGKIDLFLNFSDTRDKESQLEVNLSKAREYYDAGKILAKEFNLKNDVTVSYLLKCPDVLSDNTVTDSEEFKEILLQTVTSAMEKFNQMRKAEGEKLVNDMLSRMDFIEQTVAKIKERAPLVAKEHKERLEERIKEALGDVKYDETRLLNEVAFYTDKVNIDEELTRLNSHVSQFRSIIKTEGAGKKLDFLMQEFNRETNTICSKSNDLTVTEYGLALKNEIEKVREQVQNLE